MFNLISMIPQKQLIDNSDIEGDFITNDDISYLLIQQQQTNTAINNASNHIIRKQY